MGNEMLQQQLQLQKGPIIERQMPYGQPGHHMHHSDRGMIPDQQYQQPNSYISGPPQQRPYDGNYGHLQQK